MKANAAIVPAGVQGAVSVYATDATDVIVDINGYFVPPEAGSLAFYPVSPCRAVDTRTTSSPLGARERRTFTIKDSCNIPANATAVSINSTVVPKGPLGFLTLWPTNRSQPVVSTLNALTGGVTANAAILPLSPQGQVNAYVTDATDLILDVNGYFAPPTAAGAMRLVAKTPCRAVDTRTAAGWLGGPALTGGAERRLPLGRSFCGVSDEVGAYVFNTTVVPSGVFGYLTLWPNGELMPVVSTLNAVDGFVASNMAIVPTRDREINLFASHTGHVVFDVVGYFIRIPAQ